MKLTKHQNAVIWCLQNGWILITDSEMRGAMVGNSTHEFHIGNRLFWNLVDKGLIIQQNQTPHDFILTTEGKKIKTTPVDI